MTTTATTLETPVLAARGVMHQYEVAPRGGLLGALNAPGAVLRALEGVDVTVGEGEFVALIGPSGCGKTTLLRAVTGVLEPSQGAIEVFGAPSEAARASGAIGLVSQDAGLLPWLTVEDNVRLTLSLTGAEADVPALLERVGIARFAAYYPAQLSGGMRQRVALARALAHRPRLLLMDEPFGALDELSREELRLELIEIWEGARTSVLFVTHAVREAVLLADRVVVMSGRPGRIIAQVPIDLPRPRSEELEASPRFNELVAELRSLLRGGA
jgi:NitT/TauT family transport system ATP-binding protein